MKKKDIGIIIGVAIISAILSYVISSTLFGGEDKYNLTTPIVQPISADFPATDPRFFNPQSLNPTRDIIIGGSTNTQPF